MLRLIRYLSKEFLGPFLMGLGGFVVFVSIQILYQLSDMIVRNKVPIINLFRLIWYYLPYFVATGIPVGVLFAIFWITSRLYNDNELIAFQTLGVPTKRIVIPFLLISIILSAVTFYLFDTLVPAGKAQFQEAVAKFVYGRPEAVIQENKFVDTGNGKYFFVKHVDVKNNILNDILIYDIKYDSISVFSAESAKKENNKWYLFSGRLFKKNREGFLVFDASFKKLEYPIEKNVAEFIKYSKNADEMTTREIKDKIDAFRKTVGNMSDISDLLVEYQKKFSDSLAPLVITVLGVSLSLFINLKSKSWSVITTFILVVLYQGMGAWLTAMGKENMINPNLAPWIPDIVFGAIGLLLFFLLDTRISYKIIEPLKRIFGVFIIGFILLSASTVHAENVSIDANKLSVESTTITFEGSMVVKYKTSTFYADKGIAEINDDYTVNNAKLYGNVIYSYGEKSTVYATEISINFDKRTSLLLNSYTVQQYITKDRNKVNIRIWSEKIDKNLDEEKITSKSVKITTCKDCITYYLMAGKVMVFPEQFMIARDVTFYLFGAPVFYFPFYFQNLGEDDKSPFKVIMNYGADKISIQVDLNYNFLNNTFLTYSQTFANNLANKQIINTSKFTYGYKFPNKDTLSLNSVIENDIFNSFSVIYRFYTNNTYDSYISYTKNPLTNQDIFVVNIPNMDLPFGTLKDIRSAIYFKNGILDTSNPPKFLSLSSPAIQQVWKKSSIGLSRLTLNLDGKSSNKNLFQMFTEDLKTNVYADGKYNFYDKDITINGRFNYSKTTEATTLSQEYLDSRNNFEHLYSILNYKDSNIFITSNLRSRSEFDYRKEYNSSVKGFIDKGYLDASFSPTFKIGFNNAFASYEIKDFEFKKVMENYLTPAATDSFTYRGNYSTYSRVLGLFITKTDITHAYYLRERAIKIDAANRKGLREPYNINDVGNMLINPNELKIVSDNNMKFFASNNRLIISSNFERLKDSSGKDKYLDNGELTNFIKNSSDIQLTNDWGSYNHTTQMKVVLDWHDSTVETKPTEFATISGLIKNQDVFYFNSNSLTLKYDIDTSKNNWQQWIPSIGTDYTFYFDKNKLTGSLYFTNNWKSDTDNTQNYQLKNYFYEKNSTYYLNSEVNYTNVVSGQTNSQNIKTALGIRSTDNKEFMNLGFNYLSDSKNSKFDSFTVELQKKLICWTFKLSTKFNLDFNASEVFKLQGLTFTFFINDIPEKNVQIDKDKGFNFGLL